MRRGTSLIAALAVLGAILLTACGGNSGSSGAGLGNGLGSGPGSGLSSGVHSGGSTAPDAHGRLAVVAGENMWGDILAQLGGSAVAVTSIVDKPDEDPHEYESTLADAAAVARARLVVENGAGYDEFLSRLVGADHPSGRVVLNVADIVGAHGKNPNPHLWYDPSFVIEAATAFAKQLSALSPKDAPTFSANLETFLRGEQQIVDVIDEIKARHGGAEVGYTERVPGYLVTAAGLTVGTPSGFAQALEDGNDPNPIDNARFEDEISSHRMKVLLYNAQVTDSVTASLKRFATKHGVPVVGVTETLPTGLNFQTWQADQARELLAALDG